MGQEIEIETGTGTIILNSKTVPVRCASAVWINGKKSQQTSISEPQVMCQFAFFNWQPSICAWLKKKKIKQMNTKKHINGSVFACRNCTSNDACMHKKCNVTAKNQNSKQANKHTKIALCATTINWWDFRACYLSFVLKYTYHMCVPVSLALSVCFCDDESYCLSNLSLPIFLFVYVPNHFEWSTYQKLAARMQRRRRRKK